MIVVIADDLSGAAELAGAALQHGLTAEVQTAFFPGTDAEVVCVDTDTRLLPPVDAAHQVAAVTLSILEAKPAWIFKKCDSVLRGPVLAEAHAVANATGCRRILLVPANPSRGRMINAGTYLIAGQPLDKTYFATDPAHPRLTSDVKVLLAGDLTNVTVPDIATDRDVSIQAANVDAQTLPVGAVDFFAVLLKARSPQKTPQKQNLPAAGNTLLVCGSAASWPQRHSEAMARGIHTFSLPHDRATIISTFLSSNSVLLGIGDGPAARAATPAILAQQLAESVTYILGEVQVTRLLLEGGATSAAVLAALGWTRLRAEQVADSGVGVLRPVAVQAPLLFIKPGSYVWPDAIWP